MKDYNNMNEAFKSSKLDKLNREHGGLDWNRYNASELTDDEIGDTFDRGSRHFNGNYDITFKDGSGVHVNPSKANRNVGNGFRMTPDKEGYARYHELARRNSWSGTELPKDEYWSNNPHYNRISQGFSNTENGKHKLHPSWKEDFVPNERDSQGHMMSYDGQGMGPGTWGGEEDYGTGINIRKNEVDHAKDWYNMKNMDKAQKRSYLQNKYQGKINPALYRDNENNNQNLNENNMKSNKKQVIRLTESDLHRVIKNSVKRILRESDDFKAHGYRTASNLGGHEVEISPSGDAARFRFYGGEPTDWLEIEFDEEGVAYVETERGKERLCDYMRY